MMMRMMTAATATPMRPAGFFSAAATPDDALGRREPPPERSDAPEPPDLPRPRPPARPPPPLWGSESHVEELFAGTGVELELRRETFTLSFESVEDWIRFLETTYGPTMGAKQRLKAEGTWQDLRRELVALWESFNEASDGMQVNAEYLLVLGRKRG